MFPVPAPAATTPTPSRVPRKGAPHEAVSRMGGSRLTCPGRKIPSALRANVSGPTSKPTESEAAHRRQTDAVDRDARTQLDAVERHLRADHQPGDGAAQHLCRSSTMPREHIRLDAFVPTLAPSSVAPTGRTQSHRPNRSGRTSPAPSSALGADAPPRSLAAVKETTRSTGPLREMPRERASPYNGTRRPRAPRPGHEVAHVERPS